METFLGILVFAAIVAAIIFVKTAIDKAVDKAGNKIEQKLRKGAYAEEQQLLGTVKHYKTTASEAEIQQQLDRHVVVGDGKSLLPAKTGQNASQVNYALHSSLMGGFDARVVFSKENGITFGQFHFTSSGKTDGVTPYITQMRDLAKAVDMAFKAADPNVEVRESQQKFEA